MSPYNQRSKEHKYYTRSKRNRAFDYSRKQTYYASPFKRCFGCGIKHKKNKLVEPKSKRSLYSRATMPDPSKGDGLPTARDVLDDIQRTRVRTRANNGAGHFSYEDPLEGFTENVSRSETARWDEQALEKRIADSVEKAIAKSQELMTNQLMGVMQNMMSNLQINRPASDINLPRAPLRGAVSRTGNVASSGETQSNNNQRLNENDLGNFNSSGRGSTNHANDHGNNSLNASTSTRIANQNYVHKWNLKFEKMSAKEFLNCVKIQWEVSGYSWDQVYYNFQYLLVGQAEKRWFYQYLNSNRQATWSEFSKAFNRRFGSYETDRQITTKMDQRKQGPSEPFMVFLEAMEQLNASLEVPKTENILIEFLRDNVNSAMRPFIWMKYASNMEEFIDLCVEAELQIKKDKNKTTYYQGRVNEMNEVDSNESSHYENVEAFKQSQHFKKDPSQMVCWNCDARGHIFRDCPSSTRIIHCYRCGLKNATTPSCPNCNYKGNENRIDN